MALPVILKHIYHNASDEVIRRGKKIFHTGGVQLTENDLLAERAVFRVRNDAYYNHYKVVIENFAGEKGLSMRCQCPYNMGTVCRHEAAALFQLNDLLQSGYFETVRIDYDQRHTQVRMRQISTSHLKLFSDQVIFDAAARLVSARKVRVLEAANEKVRALVEDEAGESREVVLQQNEERYFDTSCTCEERSYPLCVHKVAAFLFLFHQHGAHFFSTIRNWDAQKNRLLALYGYSLEDDLSGKFHFHFHEGKLFLRVLDKKIRKLEALQPARKPESPAEAEAEQLQPGLFIQKKESYYPHARFQLIQGGADPSGRGFKDKVVLADPAKFVIPPALDTREKNLINALRKMQPAELFKSIRRESPFGEFWDSLPEEMKQKPGETLWQQTWDFYLPRYQNLFKQFSDFGYAYYLPESEKVYLKNMERVNLSPNAFSTRLEALPHAGGVRLKLEFVLEGTRVAPDALTLINAGLIKWQGQLWAADNTETVRLVESFEGRAERLFDAESWERFLPEQLLPLSAQVPVHFDPALTAHLPPREPELRLYLKETEKLMIFKPVFAYEDVEKEWLDFTPVTRAANGKVRIQARDEAAEQTFLNLLRYLHPSMQESRKSRAFVLPSQEALKGTWYFQFMETLQSEGVAIYGYEQLKQHKINPNKPKTNLQVSSGIDWFDTEIDVRFGEETVSLDQLKKSLAQKQHFVPLKDGSIGLLPQEWMQKYSLLVKMGAVKGPHTLRLKKYHFAALELLDDPGHTAGLLGELQEKRQRLLNYDFDNSPAVPVPPNVEAELRPYQFAGYQWMHFLEETGWGGILADDMGLGKTLQTLSFLQQYLNHNPGALFLVVCPTSLIYNWENELRKFTPEMTYLIHHGPQRDMRFEQFKSVNLVITTYGTLRSDIRGLSNITFDYAVLDESQAIKNPLSQVSRAALLLNAKNRMALSGTPVQNNTFDLYAQINFLNPGMLGSMEFFRNEFANPIDKFQEQEAKDNLRKLIHPFLLRRTKEQVAPDLPEKTETVLYCEMGAQQRKIYESFRNSFRTKILDEIEERGLERSQLSVLTGLMKLRQICDSPAILNENPPFENYSIKIKELVRELTENTGNHKALIFSQFLGMLGLIRRELSQLNIPYVYFDGGTSTTEREKAIQRFQKDDSCRVFLISLKAGGVGLNLTAADYVYIVDPWWNPAVEQQAIDRTHRIGQTKNIFAYRLICKNTIEEKILLLQERKLTLVRDLIGDDQAFLKKLTREDIEYLLS